jgi:ATP-dependent DNA ligase
MSRAPVGPWYKWKRDPLTADCVLMYAQRGSGKRSSYYSDYTFGCWTESGELLPVGKAYFGFTDEELKWLDASCATTPSTASAGARGREEPGARSGVRFDPQLDAAQVGSRHAVPADQPDPHRQAGK